MRLICSPLKRKPSVALVTNPWGLGAFPIPLAGTLESDWHEFTNSF